MSDEIFEEQFVCDLCKCRGECCVEGESGAPVTEGEIRDMERILPEIWDDLSPAARGVISERGVACTDYDGETVTSLVNGRECVFTRFDAGGVCKCVIDSAHREGRISVGKPLSCHLYPVRLTEYSDFTAVNYHRWSVCRPAVRLGRKEGVPLYRFLKEPLIRKFGEEWYREVCEAARLLKEAGRKR